MSSSNDFSPTDGILCPVCRAELPADASFCLMCGTRQTLRPPPPPPPPAPPTPSPVRVSLGREATMLGLAPQPRGTVRDTMVDPPAAPPGSAAEAPRQVANKHRTMMGLKEVAPAESPRPTPSRTLTGAVTPSPPPPSPPKIGAGRTMQGILQPPPVQVDAHAAATRPIAAPRERAPMLGAMAPGASTPPPRGRDPRTRGADSEDIYISGLSPRPKSRGAIYVAAILGAMAIGGVTAGLLLRSKTNLPVVAATLSSTDGERVTLTFALAAEPGATARVAEQSVRLDSTGSGSVQLPARAVGEVRLPMSVTRGGSTTEYELRYFIAWRVEPRFNELGAAPPRLLLEFHVPEGATLEVSRHPVRVVNGVGIASIDASEPLPLSDVEGLRRYTFPVRVQQSGREFTGEYALRVRRTPLRIDAPGLLTASAASMITVEGSAPRATRVTVGSTQARLNGDRFSADVALVPGPNDINVVAFAPGGVPASQRLTVYQNVTPDAFLNATPGAHDASLLLSPRDGARLRVRGRVLRAIEDGPEGPTFQLLVTERACASAQCVAWVDPPRGAAPREGQEIEVTGELRGSRAYVAGDGTRRSAPVIRSLFVR